MDDVEALRVKLMKSKWKEVAEKTGISYDVVRKIAKGHTERPSYQDVVKLLEYING